MSLDQVDNERLYKVGYARFYQNGHNGWCNSCRKAFTSGELQIGKIVYKPEKYDGKYAEWQHVSCFFKKFSFHDFMRRDPYFIQGFGSLR